MPVGSISGIASNLDTQAIVEAMLAYENNNGILIQARQQEITNKMSAWNSISAYLLSFKAKASILSRESAWHSKSLSNSDDSIFTATANTNATPGVYNISVNSLAAQQQLASQGFSSSTAAIGTGTIVIQVGENAAETITIDSTNNTLEGLRDAINDADAGVSASIINDGSSNNAYRLILTSEGTGLENSIDLTIDLADGTAPDFTNTSFDTPETLSWDTNATAEPSLGDTASYTGTQNKIYTFTLQGSGEMTVGSGDIYIDWSDGTNSGTITVSSADTEVALSGDGSDGLKLKFSAGELYGGDTFQVQSFSPVLQEAGDAQIEVGNSSGGGSPILITSSSNTITNVIEGVTLNLLQVSDSGPNTLTVELDKNGIANTVQGLVQEYNTMVDYLGEMMDYNPDTETAGILIGDIGLMSLQNRVHRLMANPVAGLDSDLSRLLNIGVTTGVDGQLKFDRNVLFEKLDEDLEGVIDLFRTAGHSDTEGIEFLLATDDTVMTSQGYNVNITQVATKGNYQGINITDPAVENLVVDSTNNKIKIRLNGILSETIELTQKTYTNGEELAAELQSQINDDENLGSTAVSVTWIDEGDSGYFEIESELYGSSSDVEALSAESDTAATLLGFVSGTKTDGLDVEGTINGETAHGIGQILKADDDNETTSGLSLKVTLDEDDLNSTQPEGSITLSRGVASLISYELNKYTDYIDGSIASRVNGLEKQMEIYNNQLENLEARLDKRRAQLYNQFYVMEQVISQLQNQQSYFASQIAQLG